MKTIYLTKAYSGDGLLIVLLNLQDDKPETIHRQYPQLLDQVHETIIDCNMDITTYNTSITHFWDYVNYRAYGRVNISTRDENHYPPLEKNVHEKLKSLFKRLGYAVSSEIPD